MSIVHVPMENSIKENNKNQNSSSKLKINESKNENKNLDFKKNVAFNWGKILNDTSESDIIVLVKDNKYIYAHKLVFHAQCINILVDIEPNNSNIHPHIQNKICWYKNDQVSALAFLEFIYSGDIHKNITVFHHDNLMFEIKELATLYKVKNLLLYLNREENKILSNRLKDTNQNSNNVSKENIKNTVSSEIQVRFNYISWSNTNFI
jgi:hypothetical protein